MDQLNLLSITGVVQRIESASEDCCQQIITIRNQDGVTNLIVSPETYVIDMVRLRIGMRITAFYDANAPAPLIFPPQYQALIIGRNHANETLYVGFFDETLLAEDGSLQLNISYSTEIVTSNGQAYTCSVGGQFLILYYGITTRSNPPQTTPRKIIVMC